ncbi:3-phytase [Trematosphaeria pertusa]|uniref:3-phytase n=1 Tax=Trematosphaeria pertusa TaxID=390896 RepID=A0A6A6ITE8_9PLEO|nr:3-phytase [Trematosphaeria pertusa]KAF2252860.1 3-phytase [Trematosphaeria pertusa]
MAHTLAFIPFLATHNQRPISAFDSTIDDADYVSRHWGQLSTYKDLSPNHFGVDKVGLPDGCQIEQVHLLQRHAERFPHPGDEQDGLNIQKFTEKVAEAIDEGKSFDGPLEFLNTYRNTLGGELLTGIGAMAEIASGIQFWNTYGRHLYNASDGQLGYDPDDVSRKPLLRGTTQSRIHNSLMNWALGFFGPSYQGPAQFPANWTHDFRTLVIPEGEVGRWNNTLAAHHCCNNSNTPGIGDIGDSQMWDYASIYLPQTAKRLLKHMPSSFNLTIADVYAMQLLCAYESRFIGRSEFCSLFTREEWQGFEQSLDIRFFYNHAFGQPTARAQGIGYVEELLARLQDKYIQESHSSVNSSITRDGEFFPLGMKFYADFTHDKVILGALTALSMDYFKELPHLEKYPPEEERVFRLSHLVPFSARLITEVVDCDSAHPKPVAYERVRYYASQYGYNTDTRSSKHRFVRMRLNGAILPLSSIRRGACKGRPDQLCPLDKFIKSQKKANQRANYAEACFGDYDVVNDGKDVDGTVPEQ